MKTKLNNLPGKKEERERELCIELFAPPACALLMTPSDPCCIYYMMMINIASQSWIHASVYVCMCICAHI